MSEADAEAEAVNSAGFLPWLKSPLVGGQWESGRGMGMDQLSLYLVQPLWAPLLADGADSGSLLFAQPEVVWSEGDRWFASLGLGFRHLFSPPEEEHASKFLGWLLQDGWFLGANVFGDMGNSARGYEYQQIGVGLELGSRWLTLRANHYWPLSDRNQYASFTTAKVLSRSNNTTDRYSYDVKAIPGRTDIYDVGINWRQTGSSRTSTRYSTTDFFESPQEGWDIELMALTPGLDRHLDLRWLAGLYDYGQDLRGARFGVELRPVPAVVLSATWFEDTGSAGDHWLAGVGFQIPLGAAPKTQLTPRSRNLKERLLEPIARQSQIQLGDEEETSSEVRESLVKVNAQGRFIGYTSGWTAVNGNALSAGTYIFGTRPDGTQVTLRVQRDGSLKEVDHRLRVVPEPSRTLLLVLGALSLVLRRRRRPLSIFPFTNTLSAPEQPN
jgi:hypothetical protein